MGNAGKYSQDAVLRARVLLLGSEEPSLRARLDAYRVLAEVSPRAYLPKLVDALLERARDFGDPEILRALYGEAAAAARRFDADVRDGKERLHLALSHYEHALFAVGRRAEGRAVCEELAEAGRYGRLAVVLAEEGRHGEAADLLGRRIAPRGADVSEWTLIERAAALDAAGRHEEALDVFTDVVDEARRKAAEDRAPLASLVWKLEQYARMLLAAGRLTAGAATRGETLDLLARLARGGEPVSWSNIQASWVTLLVLSGRPAEPPATPEAPLPAFGVHPVHGWSPDMREEYVASVPALEQQTADLHESGDLPGLIAAQRRLTVRRALHWETCGRRAMESLLPSFDEGVALARRLTADPGALVRALTDRSMFLLAVKRYEEAHADFAEAAALGSVLPPIVTRT
ncbi:hypothetical protein ACF07V_21845 [Streptomyces sp. NPDC015661]|uniref:hypothetical protein n=1 Tax=Streptomyces sp. NPDC015661 TaxID=3364961 RepID=UPI0036FAAF4A